MRLPLARDRSVLLLALALACAKTTAPPPVVAPATPEAPPPPGLSATPAAAPTPPGAVPPPGAPSTPPLSGTTDPVQFEGLSRAQVTFTVGVDLSPLALIDQGEAAMLEEHLAAHPRWRLTRWEGAVIAFLRVDDPQLGRTSPWAGYHGQGTELWRAALRLRPRQPGAEWTDSTLVDRFQPDDSALKVHSFQPIGSGTYGLRAAAIEVTGKVATLEVHELSARLELEQTSEALKWITTDLLSLDKFQPDTPDPAAPWGWLPPGEPNQDAKGLYVTSTPQGVDVRGRLNPGAAGWTWARITDAQGRSWLDELSQAATLERIGWSTNQSTSFWFQGRIPTDLPLPPGAIVEAWFLPDGSQTPTKIGRWSVVL